MAKARETSAGNNVPPEVVQAFTRELVKSRRAIAEAQGAHRAAMKRAKGAGINTKALSEVVTNRALDSDEVERHYRDVMRYAAINGAAYANQTDLFPLGGDADVSVTDKASAEHREWEASEAGHQAGLNGQPVENCPFPPASPLAQMWTKSWHRGQAALARTMPTGETVPIGRARGRRAAADPEAAQAAH